MKTKAFAFLVALFAGCVELRRAGAQDAGKNDELSLDAPKDWRGERISLPPGFARDMKLKGVEQVRFAPGMFDANSDSFFSYLFVFKVDAEPKLTKEILHREMLAYYRGLAVTILKGRGASVDPKSFSLKLKADKSAQNAQSQDPQKRDAKRVRLTSLHGDLKWVEPFVTRKEQTLHLEMQAWQDIAGKHSYLFVIASPKAKHEPIWKKMKSIRASFHKKSEPVKGVKD